MWLKTHEKLTPCLAIAATTPPLSLPFFLSFLARGEEDTSAFPLCIKKVKTPKVAILNRLLVTEDIAGRKRVRTSHEWQQGDPEQLPARASTE